MLANLKLIWKALAVSAIMVAGVLVTPQSAQAVNLPCGYKEPFPHLYEAAPCRGRVNLVGTNISSSIWRVYYNGSTVDWCVKKGEHKFVGMEVDIHSGTPTYLGFARNDCAGYPIIRG